MAESQIDGDAYLVAVNLIRRALRHLHQPGDAEHKVAHAIADLEMAIMFLDT